MTQFTASEVRAEAHRHANEVEDMLNAFADMLEVQERAVPVGCLTVQRFRGSDAIVNHDFDYYGSLPDGSYSLYTHPAPSDAERLEPPSNLQEALCVIENAALHGVTLHGDDIPRLRATVDRIAPAQQSQDAERLAEALRKIVEWNPPMTTDHEGKPASMSLMYGSNGVRDYFRNVAREALAVHSSRTPWTEGEKAHFKAAAELVAQREAAQAQPPAASVTDAMVNRLACWMIAQFGECRAPVDHKARIEWWRNQARSALEAALAAQENPNGL